MCRCWLTSMLSRSPGHRRRPAALRTQSVRPPRARTRTRARDRKGLGPPQADELLPAQHPAHPLPPPRRLLPHPARRHRHHHHRPRHRPRRTICREHSRGSPGRRERAGRRLGGRGRAGVLSPHRVRAPRGRGRRRLRRHAVRLPQPRPRGPDQQSTLLLFRCRLCRCQCHGGGGAASDDGSRGPGPRRPPRPRRPRLRRGAGGEGIPAISGRRPSPRRRGGGRARVVLQRRGTITAPSHPPFPIPPTTVHPHTPSHRLFALIRQSNVPSPLLLTRRRPKSSRLCSRFGRIWRRRWTIWWRRRRRRGRRGPARRGRSAAAGWGGTPRASRRSR